MMDLNMVELMRIRWKLVLCNIPIPLNGYCRKE